MTPTHVDWCRDYYCGGCEEDTEAIQDLHDELEFQSHREDTP